MPPIADLRQRRTASGLGLARLSASRIEAGRGIVLQTPPLETWIVRHELAAYESDAVRPFLPNKPRGIAHVDDLRVLNGIYWAFRSCPIPFADEK